MMDRLMKRAEELARAAQQRKVASVAETLRAMLGAIVVQAEDAQVVVSGRGLMKRWLVDPSLRFLGRGVK